MNGNPIEGCHLSGTTCLGRSARIEPQNDAEHASSMQPTQRIRQLSALVRLVTVRRQWWLLLLVPLAAWGAGYALAAGGKPALLAIAVAVALAGATILGPLTRRYLKTEADGESPEHLLALPDCV